MKKNKNNNFFGGFVCGLNMVLLVLILAGMYGVDVFSAFAKAPRVGKSIENIQDCIDGGKIISAYSEPEEATVVTIVEIESAMSQIGEITTVQYEYSGEAYSSDCNKLFNWEIGFTENSIEVFYEGVIRAGYVIEDIEVSVDQDSRTILITLPEAQVFSNEIITQDVEWDDNIFNRIDPDVASDLVEEAREEELEEAIDNGLYDDAEANAKSVIENVLAEFSDYQVVFTDAT